MVGMLCAFERQFPQKLLMGVRQPEDLSGPELRLVFTAFGIICAIRRGRTEARQLFFFSIVYLPLLTMCMMLDKV